MLPHTKRRRVAVVSPVTAGRNIPDDLGDWAISGFRDVRLIEPIHSNARFIAVPVMGDSLIKLGILDGDLLITRLTNRYVSEKLGVWQTPHGRTAKFAYQDFDGLITLHNKNGWKQSWQADEVKLFGLVIRVERDLG